MNETDQLFVVDESLPITDQTMINQPSAFSQKMSEAKVAILEQAAVQDKKFTEDVTKIVKEAAVQSIKNEKQTAELESQKIAFESEKVTTQQSRNFQQQDEDKWRNKQKRREFHYDGVKPIMEFVGISTPMNLFFLYMFVVVLIIPFLVSKLWKGTIGALLCGAEDENRSKAAKGFIWTIIALFVLIALFALIYLFLQWQGIDIFQKIKL